MEESRQAEVKNNGTHRANMPVRRQPKLPQVCIPPSLILSEEYRLSDNVLEAMHLAERAIKTAWERSHPDLQTLS